MLGTGGHEMPDKINPKPEELPSVGKSKTVYAEPIKNNVEVSDIYQNQLFTSDEGRFYTSKPVPKIELKLITLL